MWKESSHISSELQKMQLNNREICPGIWIPASYRVRKQPIVPTTWEEVAAQSQVG